MFLSFTWLKPELFHLLIEHFVEIGLQLFYPFFDSTVGRVSAARSGDTEFVLRRRHTIVIKNSTNIFV